MPDQLPAAAPQPGVSMAFSVLVDGHEVGLFTGVQGLQGEYEVVEWKEGGNNAYTHRLPGRRSYPNVKLTRPVDAHSAEIARWFSSFATTVRRGQVARIDLFDAWRRPVAHWELRDVWPVRYTGPTLGALLQTVATETLELAHNGFGAA
jgi:phage tail-like protein